MRYVLSISAISAVGAFLMGCGGGEPFTQVSTDSGSNEAGNDGSLTDAGTGTDGEMANDGGHNDGGVVTDGGSDPCGAVCLGNHERGTPCGIIGSCNCGGCAQDVAPFVCGENPRVVDLGNSRQPQINTCILPCDTWSVPLGTCSDRNRFPGTPNQFNCKNTGQFYNYINSPEFLNTYYIGRSCNFIDALPDAAQPVISFCCR